MQSLGTKYSFSSYNIVVTAFIIYTIQVLPALVESLPEYENEMITIYPTQNSIKARDFISLLCVKKIMGSFVENNDYSIAGKSWLPRSAEKSVNVLPRLRKRNLEHLAKSSGGYLKRIQSESNHTDKKEDVKQITKIIHEILGKRKRGVHTLAKNRDFPHKNYKPKMREVSIGTYVYIRRGPDFRR